MKEQKKQKEQENNEETSFNLVEIRSDPIEEHGNEYYPWTLYTNSHSTDGVNWVIYSLYLYTDIVEPSHYTRLFEIIRNMNEEDEFNIYINSPGGSLQTLISFINIITNCKACVITHIDGFAESAAAILAFTGKKVFIGKYSSFMFHNIQSFSDTLEDTGHIKAGIETLHKIYEKILTEYCSSVLTKSQIKNIIKSGLEVYMTGDEIIQKLKNKVDILNY